MNPQPFQPRPARYTRLMRDPQVSRAVEQALRRQREAEDRRKREARGDGGAWRSGAVQVEPGQAPLFPGRSLAEQLDEAVGRPSPARYTVG